MTTLLALAVISMAAATAAANEQLKAVTHMKTVWQTALALNQITKQLEKKMTEEISACAEIKAKFLAAAATATQSQDTAAANAALPVVIKLAAVLASSETTQAQNQQLISVAAIRTANLTGQHFMAATVGELKVPNIKTGQTAGSSMRGGASNIYVTKKEDQLTQAQHTEFNKLHPHMAAWTTEANYDGIQVWQPELASADAGNTREPYIGGNVAGGGNNNCNSGDKNGPNNSGDSSTNICVTEGVVLTMKSKKIKKDNAKYGEGENEEFTEAKQIHQAQRTANSIKDAISTTSPACANFGIDNINSFTADDNFKAAVGALFGELDRKTSLATDNTQIKSLIKNIYGEGTEMKTKFWDKLKNINKPAKILGEDASGDITTVSDLSTAFKLLLETKVKENKQKKQEKTTETSKDQTGSEDKTEEKKVGDKTAKPVCSSIQNQTACEAVTGTSPTGKAKVCGWIEGKCQDSSFLLNKQFALSMVSAAFVALLF
uniref:Variant surface glycoprotein n=1 Tax=Trypanosoma brucei TaxID=5691 RepID=A0A1V0FY20_9TRYP|nr:variant surface glycoprotein [Trypanosoma brucei]